MVLSLVSVALISETGWTIIVLSRMALVSDLGWRMVLSDLGWLGSLKQDGQ